MASRNLDDLHPIIRAKAARFLKKCEAEDIQVLIYCTYRSDEEQAELYAQGRTKPGRIVTYAKPGQSRHNYRMDGCPASLAFDCVPLRHGKPVWGNTKREDWMLWQDVGHIGESVGLEWAGRWKRFREFPHFQITI